MKSICSVKEHDTKELIPGKDGACRMRKPYPIRTILSCGITITLYVSASKYIACKGHVKDIQVPSCG